MVKHERYSRKLIVTFIQMTHINNMRIITMKEKVMYDEKQEVFK